MTSCIKSSRKSPSTQQGVIVLFMPQTKSWKAKVPRRQGSKAKDFKEKSKSFLVTSFAAFLPALPSLLLARTCQSWTAKGKFTALPLEMAQRCSDIPTYPETPGPDLSSKSLHSTPLHISSLKADSQQMFVRQNYLLSKYTHRHTLSSSSFPFQEHMPLK